jgi:nanoRNase/pAp phosphatase (c-di-AMP/oligoRNAs hydrolase)
MKINDRKIQKSDIPDQSEKNRLIRNIIEVIDRENDFLIAGHIYPDEDCIASMISLGLILTKLNKKVTLYIPTANQRSFSYLLDICTYNAIPVASKIENIPSAVSVLAVLDTPKTDMIAGVEELRELPFEPRIIMEIDHHLAADSTMTGEDNASLVMSASSTCEILGIICLEMQRDSGFMDRYNIYELFSRNLVLTLITGIISDSRMGQFLITPQQRWFYDWISGVFDRMLSSKTYKDSSNFASKEEVFSAMSALSNAQKECFVYLMDRKRALYGLSAVVLNSEESAYIHERYEHDIFIGVVKTVADRLAEESESLGLVAYYDAPGISSLIQFRLRRSQKFQALDLRDLLVKEKIENGGGHPGAVGFRFEKESISDYGEFTDALLATISADVAAIKK